MPFKHERESFILDVIRGTHAFICISRFGEQRAYVEIFAVNFVVRKRREKWEPNRRLGSRCDISCGEKKDSLSFSLFLSEKFMARARVLRAMKLCFLATAACFIAESSESSIKATMTERNISSDCAFQGESRNVTA